MLTIIKADGSAERRQLDAMRARAAEKNADIELTVKAVMEDVRREGLPAVERYSREFDGKAPCELSRERLEQAYAACPSELIDALEHAARNIRDYNEKLLSQTQEWTSPDGGRVGRIVRGLSRVGIYVPGGTAAYPSSVLMNAVPAKVAGVEEIIMLTPPTENLSDAVLAAAKIAGVDRVIAVGGAQAVAAVTYGAGFIPRVDKLVGPGNAYVAAAKRLAYGQLDIDMVAGPSEVLVIADGSADPQYVAADLLSQAEHDRLASAVLLTDDLELAQAVDGEIIRQTGYLSRSEIMEASLRDFGCAIVCGSLDQCMELANEIAPEHLEIVTKAPRELLPKVKNAGAVFLGSYTPEPLGDYLAGPDHVLPTSGTARFFSPLSVDSFLKTMSVLEYDRASLEPIAGEIITLAEAEKLTAHANSIKVRFESNQPDHETLSMTPMTRELCHEFYREFVRDPATFMDMSLFEPYVYDPKWVDRYFDRQQRRPDREAFLFFRNLKPIGEVILKEIDLNKKECVLSIHMQNDSVKGKGYGTKAILMAYVWARDVLGMQAVKADVVLKNTRSQHILEKLGFRLVSEDETFKYYQRP